MPLLAAQTAYTGSFLMAHDLMMFVIGEKWGLIEELDRPWGPTRSGWAENDRYNECA